MHEIPLFFVLQRHSYYILWDNLAAMSRFTCLKLLFLRHARPLAATIACCVLLASIGWQYHLQHPSRLPETLNYHGRLYTPTQITKIDGLYFIVDCRHHRILFSNSLEKPLTQWQTLEDDIAGPHSIVSDGELYVTEDTERHRVFVYKKQGDGFVHSQTIENVGLRPHRTRYHAQNKLFYVVGSRDYTVYMFRNIGGQLVKIGAQPLPQLNEQYTRSMTIFNGRMYFSSMQQIMIARIDGEKLAHERTIALAKGYSNTVELFFMEDGSGYLSTWRGKLLRFNRIDELGSGTAENLSKHMLGMPYYIEQFDGRIWVPEVLRHSRIVSYPIAGNRIDFSSKKILFDSGAPTQASQQRKDTLKSARE